MNDRPTGTRATLPEHPDTDQLRRQARELLRAWRCGEPSALARATPYALPALPRLAHAQLVLARELGFASWPKLLDEIEHRRALALHDEAFVERVLVLALGRGYAAPRPAQALALLQSRPRLRHAALRLVQGDADGVDPRHALPPWHAPPLALVAFSSLATLDDAQDAALCAAADRLLAAGADANAGLIDPAFTERPLPVLYGAVARARSAALVLRLLAAGADPNDNESLYHAVEQDDRRIVAALVAAGARWPGTNALFRQLDFEPIAHLQQVLELGADADELSSSIGTRPLHHAVSRGRSLAHLQLLVQHGADIAATDSHGHTLAWHAARAGRTDVLTWLAPLGQKPPDGVVDRFLAACAAADESTARALLARQPNLITSLAPWQRTLLPEQAQRGALASVQLMLALGWPVDVPGPWQASALNQAAFRGDSAMVALLLRHGAHWHERNGYGGDALGSCLHAGCNEPVPGGDYAEVLRLLLADGAPSPEIDDHLPDEMAAVVEGLADAR
ncbi:ankyrin repeat domain-containing protein [Aquabacterium humicola]|uniref:ankyrin repeat domain-containing protein n=1 Tax=Aquabacterium humicola TaxID=3237377 RepID=UPI0025431B2F|nr:ankyrin repeat domain-containing protein [Rubrivivax pictus]